MSMHSAHLKSPTLTFAPSTRASLLLLPTPDAEEMGLLRQKTIMESFAPCKRTDAIQKQVRQTSLPPEPARSTHAQPHTQLLT